MRVSVKTWPMMSFRLPAAGRSLIHPSLDGTAAIDKIRISLYWCVYIPSWWRLVAIRCGRPLVVRKDNFQVTSRCLHWTARSTTRRPQCMASQSLCLAISYRSLDLPARGMFPAVASRFETSSPQTHLTCSPCLARASTSGADRASPAQDCPPFPSRGEAQKFAVVFACRASHEIARPGSKC